MGAPGSVRAGPYRRVMTDPGLVASLGIEGVEWLDEAGDRATVRISGRWRRRPSSTGQPWLVIDASGKRHRFPAMPEPPGLSGTLPGTWRMSFRVPADIARAPDVRAWLQLGALLVPLPAEPAAEPVHPGLEPRSVEVSELAEAARDEQLREAEHALESARARATAAESAAGQLAARVAEVGHELEEREAELTRLTVTLAEHERSVRHARQAAHAEEMVRHELSSERDQLEDMLEVSRLQVSALEDALVRLRRRADEAEHLAAAARRTAPPPPRPVPIRSRRRSQAYSAERALARQARAANVRTTPRPLPAPPMWSVRERELVTLRTHQALRSHGPHLAATLDALRDELSDLHTIAEREREGRGAAEAVSERLRHQVEEQTARSERAFAALDALRDQLDWVRQAYAALGEGETPPAPPPDPASEAAQNGGLERHRLDAARTRLREQTPALPDETADEPPPGRRDETGDESPPGRRDETGDEPASAAPGDTRPPFTLAPTADRAPETAATLLLELLPAQGIVHPAALAYDLILDPATCVRVTVADGGPTAVNWMHTSRAREDVRFQLEGHPASIVRLLTAGALRRRLLRRGLAKVRGDRSGLAALRDLMTAQLSASELSRAGVRLDELDLAAELDADADAGPTNRATSG